MDSSSILDTAVNSALISAQDVITVPTAGVMFSAIALAVILVIIVGLVFWLLFKNNQAPLAKLEERIEKMQETLQDISSKLWTEPALDNKIENAVMRALREHEKSYHNQD